MTDLAILGQDPRFGGGAWALSEAFWRAATELGRDPTLYYLAHPSLAGRAPRPPLDGPGLRPPFGRLDLLNQLWGAGRLAPELRAARSLWVVATSASYGAAASRSGRPYTCWVATALGDEWRPQLGLLPRSRRVVRRVNGPPLRALERRVLQGAAAVYTISAAARDAVARAGRLQLNRVGVIPLPVDLAAFAPVPADTYVAGLAEPKVLFVGRGDDPRKNVSLLLAAWPEILRRHPRARLRLVGRPPRGPLPARAESIGEVSSVARELREATIFVLPSLQEGFGLVAAEALAAGVPVVTTPSGGPEELVRSSGGGVVLDRLDRRELAEVVSGILGDVEGLLRMRVAGRVHVENEHSPERTSEAVRAALEAAR